MLNFDEERFLDTQRGAVALADELHGVVSRLLDRGATSLGFVGAGGAGILMMPAAAVLQQQSGFRAWSMRPLELIAAGSAQLGPESIVVMPSLSGTTSDTVDALGYCRARGATVITLTGNAKSPLAEQADINFTNPAADDTSSESFYLQSLIVALCIMDVRGELNGYAELISQLKELPTHLLEAKSAFEDQAASIAAGIAEEPWHIITGAGLVWPEAWYYGMCILEEMQWIRTRPVNAADFFHGTLELVDNGVSVVVMKGEDATRPLADRVERFVSGRTEKLLVLDAAEVAARQVNGPLRGLISPILLATVLERVSAHLELLTKHPLITRRYYRRVEY